MWHKSLRNTRLLGFVTNLKVTMSSNFARRPLVSFFRNTADGGSMQNSSDSKLNQICLETRLVKVEVKGKHHQVIEVNTLQIR